MTQENVVTKTASLINANINIFYQDRKRFSPPPPVSDAHEFELYRKVFLYNFDHSLLRTLERKLNFEQTDGSTDVVRQGIRKSYILTSYLSLS